MRTARLIRLETSESGTIGVLKVDEAVRWFTLEPPDKENQVNISSIPAKQYTAEKRVSRRHGETFTLKDVPNRFGINFHAGYIVKHTEGCILLGKSLLRDDGEVALINSEKAFTEFMELLKDDSKFHLTIVEEY